MLLKLASALPTGRRPHLSSDFNPVEDCSGYELAPLIVFGPTKSITVTLPHSKEHQNVFRGRRRFTGVFGNPIGSHFPEPVKLAAVLLVSLRRSSDSASSSSSRHLSSPLQWPRSLWLTVPGWKAVEGC